MTLCGLTSTFHSLGPTSLASPVKELRVVIF